ncbi:hypothetical protein [Thermobifida cellulosilytica]|uniref:Uncharacterized protein n=1 Tax=Thermobifida cellulosilytica TB100 TaxID=665004 RepID=A0A147KN18_THECS|nr:hypothetical protein [Thermobifida cellulosilytica]KUP98680.1 hypothetical protein AC529_00115 [Thermobifida cellulosilytica TB100]
MHAPVRNTTFAALVTAGLFAVSPAAHADTAADGRGPAADDREWGPVVDVPIRVCGDSLALLRQLADCSDSPAAEGADEVLLLPPGDRVEEPDRCQAGEDCLLGGVAEAAGEGPAEQPDTAEEAAAEPDQDAQAEQPAPAAGAPWPVRAESVLPKKEDAPPALPETAPVPTLRGLPRIPEQSAPLDLPGASTYALTATGTKDAPLLSAGVATVLLGGVAIYVGYGLGRSDRPNLFR